MNLRQERQVHKIFLRALEKPSEDRLQFLERNFGHDPELLRLVLERLHAAEAMEGTFRELGADFHVHSEDKTLPSQQNDPSGLQIGSYIVIRNLGEGGMGTVYLADRADGEFNMRVAIKVTRRDLTSGEVVRRFKLERQIMATLQHPYIAALHDGGTTAEGFPYFVMEYVDGKPIDEYCSENALNLNQRLDLFRKTCEGVAFAHRNGIVHRDIKPGNILVTREGEPKLLDFGIASSNADPKFTATGGKLLTPAFASPEQIRGEEVGFESDVYSLGVLLYELITGESPYQLKGVSNYEISRIICEETPIPPSSLMTGMRAEQEPSRASSEPTSDLAGLDQIVGKALRKDPSLRYASAVQLVERIQLYQAGLRIIDPEEKPFDAYLCVKRARLPMAKRIAEYLKDRLEISFETEAFGCEDLSRQAFEARLDDARCCVILVDTEERQPWHFGALRQSLAVRTALNSLKVVPLLLPGAKRPPRETSLPRFLRRVSWPAMASEDDERAMDQIAAMIENRVVPANSAVSDEEVCPFRGLESFQEKDQAFFFGRESLTQRLSQYLEDHRFLAVLGPSGSGKSSLVRAGLIPELRSQGYPIALFSPTARPLNELAFALYRIFPSGSTDLSPERLMRQFEKTEDALHQYVQGRDFERVMIVIDQFEELFTLSSNPNEREWFLKNLLHAVDQEDSPISVVITMRSDFLGQCTAWPDLNCFVNENLVQVGPMGKDALRHAVEEPARLVGLGFEEGLVERMLSEVSGAPGELPLIQHALLELYKYRQASLLTSAAYTKIGGVEGALARRAEAEYAVLDQKEQDILREMFVLCLVQPVEGADDAKRCATRAELLAIGDEPNLANRLLQRWTAARLLTVHRDDLRKTELVEVAHEALIRRWERINVWMDEDRDMARLVNRLRQESRAWADAGQSPDLLARGVHLIQFKELSEQKVLFLGPLEEAYIAAASEIHDKEEMERERRRKWELKTARDLAFRSRIIATITLLGLVGLGVAAWLLWRQERQTQFLLADSYWRESQTAWKEGNLPLALHLTGEALKNFPSQSKESLLIHFQLMMENGSWPLFTLHHQGYVAGAMFDHGEKRILTWSFDRTLQLWDATTGRQLGKPMHHDDKVWGAVFNQTDSRILSWGFDQTLRLWDATNGLPVGKPMRHSDNIWGAAFARDDRQALSWSFDGTLRLWDLSTGETIGKPFSHEKVVIGARFSSDEKRILSWSKDGTLQLWDRATQEVVFPSMKHENWVWGATFDKDESKILSWSKDGTLRLWDTATGKQLGQTMAHGAWVKGALFHKDGNRILSWSDDHSLRLWDSQSGEPLGAPMNHEGKLVGATFDRDGGKILSWSEDFSLRLWDTETGALIGVPMLHNNKVLGAIFSPNRKQILSWSLDRTWRLWDIATGQQVDMPYSHGDVILGAAFNGQGNRILTWAYDKTIRLWATPELGSTTHYSHDGEVMGALFSADERRILSFGGDHLRLWDTTSGKQLGPAMFHGNNIWGAIFNRDETRILSWGRDNTVRLWDSLTFHQIGETMFHEGLVRGALFTKDESAIVSWSHDGTIRFWEASDGKPSNPTITLGDWVRGASLDAGEQRVLAWSNDGLITLWDRNTGQALGSPLQHDARVVGASFDHTEKRILSWAEDNTIRLWSTQHGKPLGPGLQHDDIVWGATFFKEEDRILSWSYDKTLRIWDVATAQQLGSTMFHDDVVLGALLIDDEKRILSWSRDKTLRIWDIAMGRQLGPPILHDHQVTGALLNQSETRVLSWAGNQIRSRSLGADFDIPLSLIDQQIHVTTGSSFDPINWNINPLTDEALGSLRETYLVRGLSHFVECRHREHNLFGKRHLDSVEVTKQMPKP